MIASHPECDLVVFPELFLSGISRDGYEDLHVAIDGPELAGIAAASRSAETSVVIGTALATAAGTTNAAISFDPAGARAGIYEKTHRWNRERLLIHPGRSIEPTRVGDLRAGLMICFDVEFPEVGRALALSGAEVLITIAANMEPYGSDHALLARARAVENRLPHIYVNRVGRAAGSNFVGESRVFDGDGRVLAQADADVGVLVVDVEVGTDREGSPVDYLSQRRPDLYGALVDRDAG